MIRSALNRTCRVVCVAERDERFPLADTEDDLLWSPESVQDRRYDRTEERSLERSVEDRLDEEFGDFAHTLGGEACARVGGDDVGRAGVRGTAIQLTQDEGGVDGVGREMRNNVAEWRGAPRACLGLVRDVERDVARGR